MRFTAIVSASVAIVACTVFDMLRLRWSRAREDLAIGDEARHASPFSRPRVCHE